MVFAWGRDHEHDPTHLAVGSVLLLSGEAGMTSADRNSFGPSPEPPLKSDNAREAAWICHDCAIDNGATFPNEHIATFHDDLCSVCGEFRVVTQPRDYRWPMNEVSL